MGRLRLITVFLVTLWIYPPTECFAASEVIVNVSVDKAFMTIGDRVQFRVTVTHSPDVKVLGIDAQGALRDFDVKKVKDFSTEEDGYIQEGKNYTITTYALGEFVISPFEVEYRTADGDVNVVKTNSLYVTVQSIDNEKDPSSDIRGVKGVLGIKGSLWPWILALALLTVIGGAGAWYLLRSRVADLVGRGAEVVSPHDEAYNRLHTLKHSDLLRKKGPKPYFFQMSEILRHYFERRFLIPALESTTFEVMKSLKELAPQKERALINEVLEFCDSVKFAKYTPEAQEVIRINKFAINIIDKTKEIEAEPVVATSALEAKP